MKYGPCNVHVACGCTVKLNLWREDGSCGGAGAPALRHHNRWVLSCCACNLQQPSVSKTQGEDKPLKLHSIHVHTPAMAHSPPSQRLSGLHLKGNRRQDTQKLLTVTFAHKVNSLYRTNPQHTSFLYNVFSDVGHCVLYVVARHTRVGLHISRAVIKVTQKINTQQTKLERKRFNIH